MANKKKISFRLSKELDDWIRDQIESGRFESWTQAVEEGITLLQDRLDGKKQ
jgi:Arc/MetJ-type ribon-helix-helix transcriptional regulator